MVTCACWRWDEWEHLTVVLLPLWSLTTLTASRVLDSESSTAISFALKSVVWVSFAGNLFDICKVFAPFGSKISALSYLYSGVPIIFLESPWSSLELTDLAQLLSFNTKWLWDEDGMDGPVDTGDSSVCGKIGCCLIRPPLTGLLKDPLGLLSESLVTIW